MNLLNLTFLFLVLLLLEGCFSAPSTSLHDATRLPMPTKDEIALIDNHPLTIAAFLKIRSRLQTRSPETALWVGISMIALQNKTRAEGREISSLAAYDIVRYAIRDLSTSDARSALIEYFRETVPLPDPDFVKKEIQSISDKTSVLRNPLPLSFFK